MYMTAFPFQLYETTEAKQHVALLQYTPDHWEDIYTYLYMYMHVWLSPSAYIHNINECRTIYRIIKNYELRKEVGIDHCYKIVRKQNVDCALASIG